ncbi:E3 ubiquitin-protein ligase NRDP1-like [Bradysia coprophila]|uniref:E3 ubiquitin-protein ligase NRDP1-like n=1 Tax=Bradysia coprophila TaxID=38358 RepID=UPI00187D6F5B|nr:E3 ubiquitin-protein ligase NRDP1-like [Bradysia coprophila]
MGFESAKFIGKIDEEFMCTICTQVLENPVQSSCEHIFCHACINEWLAKVKTCPVCRDTITKNVEPVARYFRNLLNKLELKCDFASLGCKSVLKLEDFKDHIAGRCVYNPNMEIACDKGCNITIRRHEYEASDCISHLSNALKQLQHTQNEQTKIVNSLRWQICYNMNISVNEPNILEYGQWNDDADDLALVQSMRPLARNNTSFKIEILNGGDSNIMVMGLTGKGYPINMQPGWHSGSIGFRSDGKLFNGSRTGNAFGSTWESGDIIECGLQTCLPARILSSYQTFEVYFSKNELILGSTLVRTLEVEIFPTLGLQSKGSKVRYIDS